MLAAFRRFQDIALGDSGWKQYAPIKANNKELPDEQGQLKQLLLEKAIAVAVVGRFVEREEVVPGTKIQWQKLEEMGLVCFVPEGMCHVVCAQLLMSLCS